MKPLFNFFLLAFLMLSPGSEIQAAVLAADLSSQNTIAQETAIAAKYKPKKTGVFQKYRAIKSLKKLVQAKAADGEKASKLSKIALAIFAGSLGLGLLSNWFPPLGYLAFAGIIASNCMAIVVLVNEENRKSKKLAKVVLFGTLAILLLTLLFYLLLVLLLLAIFA